MEKFDLHVHTTYSDGNSSVKEAIQVAQAKNLIFLAITDHFTTTWKQSVIDTIDQNNFEVYRQAIIKERELARYNCLIGIEIDAGSNFNAIRQIPFNQFEIVLFEYVDSIVTLEKLESLIQELELPSITALAHNTYFKLANLEKLSTILVKNNIYFEVNSRYLSHFDSNAINRLKILKDHGVKFTIGSDAHDKTRIGDTDLALSLLEQIDGVENLIDLSDYKLIF